MTLPYTAKTYTGKAFKPVPKVTAQVGGKTLTLKNKTDYTVAYKNNKAAGKATVTVTGTGNYTGTLTKTFTIKPVKIATVTLAKTSMPYTGKAVKPKVTVKARVAGKSVTLKVGTDYTVKYVNNVKAGTAKVIVTGKGNFTGTVTKTFKIVKK